MGWVTVYISGREGFQDAVLSKLEGVWLLGSPETGSNLVMYWLSDAEKLRSLKESIGSKMIFKYRLRFFTDLDSHLKLKRPYSTEFSLAEKEMVNKMVSRDEHRKNRKRKKSEK